LGKVVKVFHLIFPSGHCTIQSTNESGECVPLIECNALVGAFQKDRSQWPTICNRELRKVCCPLKSMPVKSRVNVEETSETTTEGFESDFDESEQFVASQFMRSELEFD
jgi:hypothetical protein